MTKEDAIKIIEDARAVVLGNGEYDKAMGMAIEALKAEPVKHGRWRDVGGGQECSVCSEIQYGYDSYRNYCANCGAKMDLDEVEE